MLLEELREKAHALPLLPGVYIMKDAEGEVIYVGKAKRLKNRVSSYFRASGHEGKTAALVAKIRDFDVIIADTEFEALVLENSLIKRYMPRYNILLKDDKGYPFIRIDLNRSYPRFQVVSAIAEDGARYFGPYGGRGLTFEVIETTLKALSLPTCSRRFPAELGKGRPCLNYHMGNCLGWCRGQPDGAAYRRQIEEALLILDGRIGDLEKSLQTQMEQAAEALRFEQAVVLRDRLRSLEKLQVRQRIVWNNKADTDVCSLASLGGKSCFVVLRYIEGTLLDKDLDIFETPLEENDEALSALVRQYYLRRGTYPKNIYLPWPLPDMSALERLFSENAGTHVRLQVPQRGEKKRLTETAQKNAEEELQRLAGREGRTLKTLEALQKLLQLPAVPRRIEAFDISNLGEAEVVASMVVFQDAKPKKGDYKRFKIKDLETRGDAKRMAEVVTRRYSHMQAGDAGFAAVPDLVLIDGGTEHAKSAAGVLWGLGLKLPVFGMVKDDRHRTRALQTPEGAELGISGNPALFALVGRIQEEAHRFAIEYQRKLHGQHSYRSALEKIEGVGQARRQALLKHFGSVSRIRQASLEELAAVVPRNAAEHIYNYFLAEGKKEEAQCESSQVAPEEEN